MKNLNGGSRNRSLTISQQLKSSITILFAIVLYSMSSYAQNTEHFTTTWQGENGFGHMNIYIVTAILDDKALQTGDEIAAFSGDLCVGATKLTEPSNNKLINLITSLDDGSNNGFMNGDTIILKLWDKSLNAEHNVTSIAYRNELSSWVTNGRYSFNASSFVDIKTQTYITQDIKLKSGWNIFSGYLVLNNPDMLTALDDLIENKTLHKVQDEQGKSIENISSMGGWVNNIGKFKNTEGYKIKVNADETLTLKGLPVDIPTQIPLSEGWNIIAYPLNYETNAMSVLQSLINQNLLEKVKDEEGNSIEDWGEYGGWINNIGNLKPGEGYEIKVKAATSLTITNNYTKSQTLYTESNAPMYFTPSAEGNGLNHMNINIISLSNQNLEYGDELAVFDNDICVGAVSINNTHLQNNALVINASASDGNKNGFTEGDAFKIMIKKKSHTDADEAAFSALLGQTSFTEHASSFIKLEVASGIFSSEYDHSNVSIYPNPTQNIINIDISHPNATGNTIELLNITGMVIDQKKYNGITSKFDLSDHEKGIYFIRTSIDNKTMTQKVLLQ